MRMWPLSGKSSAKKPLTKLNAMVEEARAAMYETHGEWDEWRLYYDSTEQYEMVRKRLSDTTLQSNIVVSNLIFPAIETYVATLISAIGEWFVVADNPQNDENARILTKWIQSYFRVNRVPAEFDLTFRDALIYGTGIAKVYWDEGKDEVFIRAIDPYMVFPDPTARRVEEAEYIAVRNAMSEQRASRTFDNFDKKRANVFQSDGTGDIEPAGKVPEMYEIWEMYYDAGKRLAIFTGDHTLWDGEATDIGAQWPVFFFQISRTTDKFWPDGIISHIQYQQDAVNRTRTRLSIHEHYTANPVMVMPEGTQAVSTNPGAQIKVRQPGGEVNWLNPPMVLNYVLDTLNMAKADMDTITGVHDALRGIRPTGVTSGIGLESLQQAAQTRMAGSARDWQDVVQAMGNAVLKIAQERYTTERMLATVDNGEPERVSVTPDMLTEFEEQEDEYGIVSPVLVPTKYRVVMAPGGDLPLSPSAKAELAMRLHQQGAIDTIALLDAVKFDGRAGVIERLQQQEQAMLQGQQAGMQQQQQAQADAEAQMQAMMAPEQPADQPVDQYAV